MLYSSLELPLHRQASKYKGIFNDLVIAVQLVGYHQQLDKTLCSKVTLCDLALSASIFYREQPSNTFNQQQ